VNWQAVGLLVYTHVKVFLSGIGLTGGGVGLIKLAKHWPAPLKKNLKLGAIFDTIQDVISNNERIGQRRDADSAFVATTEADGKSASAQSVTEPKAPNGQEKTKA
jgi:hypothetical protein